MQEVRTDTLKGLEVIRYELRKSIVEGKLRVYFKNKPHVYVDISNEVSFSGKVAFESLFLFVREILSTPEFTLRRVKESVHLGDGKFRDLAEYSPAYQMIELDEYSIKFPVADNKLPGEEKAREVLARHLIKHERWDLLPSLGEAKFSTHPRVDGEKSRTKPFEKSLDYDY